MDIYIEKKEFLPIPHIIKNSFKQILDLNVKAETIKILGENTEEYFEALRVGKSFLGHGK